MKTNTSISVGQLEQRGRLVVQFLEQEIQPLDHLRVLDLGCGSGDISEAIDASGAKLTATDLNPNNLRRTRGRLRADSDPTLCASSALSLPFTPSQFDLVLLNGVLEWVGKAAPEANPEASQLQALQEVYRTLKPGGWLYVAIENRYYPKWLLGDPHIALPLVAVLPRRLANLIHRVLRGSPYVTYIHSHRKLQRLIRQAGFQEIELYIPLLHYRWPFRVVRAGARRQLVREIVTLSQQAQNGDDTYSGLKQLKFALYRYAALLGLSRFFFPSFVVLARRSGS